MYNLTYIKSHLSSFVSKSYFLAHIVFKNKIKLAEFPVLGYPDPNKRYILYTDASNDCICTCLTQPCDDASDNKTNVKNEKPIYYLYHKLSDTQTRWSTVEKEAFAIHFYYKSLTITCIINAEFTIKTGAIMW